MFGPALIAPVQKKPIAESRAKGATHKLPASILPLPRPSTRPRAWILFQQRAAAPWSFTDRTRKIVIDDLRHQDGPCPRRPLPPARPGRPTLGRRVSSSNPSPNRPPPPLPSPLQPATRWPPKFFPTVQKNPSKNPPFGYTPVHVPSAFHFPLSAFLQHSSFG